MCIFNNLKILVGILFGPSLLYRFKLEIILETSVKSVGIVKTFNIQGWKVITIFSKI